MDKLKQWVAATVLLVLVILAGGWFLLISPKKQEANDIRALADTQVAANAALKTQLSVLRAQAKALPREQAKLAAVAAKIPENPGLPTLIRALSKAADDAGVELLTLAPAKPVPVVAIAAVPAAAPAAGAPAAGATAAPAAGAAAGVTTTSAASSAAGQLQSIGLSLNVVGGYFEVEQFLDRLESLARAMKVTQVNMTPGINPNAPVGVAATQTVRTVTATILGTVFMATGRTTTPTTPIAGK